LFECIESTPGGALYANDKAMQGYRGGQFPDGAVIVFDRAKSLASCNATEEIRGHRRLGFRRVIGPDHCAEHCSARSNALEVGINTNLQEFSSCLLVNI
jgi:hypothetical protein